MRRFDVLETLELAASDQWGIITTAQAEREGITRLQLSRLAEDGALRRARRGVYLLPSHSDGPLTDLQTAWISLEPSLSPLERREVDPLVASHQSAAMAHRIGNQIPARHFFSAASKKKTSQKDIHVYSPREIPRGDIVYVHGLPVTSVQRTIADLAAQQTERQYLSLLVADGAKKEDITLRSLADSLEPHARAYGARSGEDLVIALEEEGSSGEDRALKVDDLRILAKLGRQRMASEDHIIQLARQIVALYDAQVSES